MNQAQTTTMTLSSPLLSPRAISIELPPTEHSCETVERGRAEITRIISGRDKRLLLIIGPCSIHDPQAALEYAHRLNKLRNIYMDRLNIVMRVYFEKPRTTVGWKGLINDPHMDGSYDMMLGLRTARKLLVSITDMGLPAAMELLNPLTSHYIGDLASYAAIGARTAESQVHREMASGLAMPVGFKNNTDGSIEAAACAISSSRNQHSFMSIDRNGRICMVRTKGNKYGHIILRGSRSGPNYDKDSIQKASFLLSKSNAFKSVIIDCSHENSRKQFEKQAHVLNEVVNQRVEGEQAIVGLMLESNINEGRQNITKSLKYGVSVTDPCVGWDTTAHLIKETYEKMKGL